METKSTLNLKSLREQVYEHLRQAINRGALAPGAFIDLKRIGEDLGISKTPLRDALIQLESEGFVTILARRGVVVNRLTVDDIRHLYEIVGALEGVAVVAVSDHLRAADFRTMRDLNAAMAAAVNAGDFDAYYQRNLAFHNVVLDLSGNARLVKTVSICKQRLYDFPRKKGFVREWELASTGEHDAFVELLEAGEARAAADYLRDVHWSFAVQEKFIHRYYFASQAVLNEVER